MAKKTKKASKDTARQPTPEILRFRRVVKERVELAKTVCRMREVAVAASADLWRCEHRSAASRGASSEAIVDAVVRLMQSTKDYGTAIKQMHDHGASLGSIAEVAGLDDVTVEEIQCAMAFSE
jgi:hypothetical protein